MRHVEPVGIVVKLGSFLRLLGFLSIGAALVLSYFELADYGAFDYGFDIGAIGVLFEGAIGGIIPGVFLLFLGSAMKRAAQRAGTMRASAGGSGTGIAAGDTARSGLIARIAAHNAKELERVLRGKVAAVSVGATPAATPPAEPEKPTERQGPPTIDRPATRRKSVIER